MIRISMTIFLGGLFVFGLFVFLLLEFIDGNKVFTFSKFWEILGGSLVLVAAASVVGVPWRLLERKFGSNSIAQAERPHLVANKHFTEND